jgi:hypothetical protein
LKSHYCPEEKGEVQYDGQCNWCGEKEMNVDKLIIDLECTASDVEYGEGVCDWKLLNDAANMLRSQAAQLEESRAANHRLTELITLQREHIEELRQEIYKLKGQ